MEEDDDDVISEEYNMLLFVITGAFPVESVSVFKQVYAYLDKNGKKVDNHISFLPGTTVKFF